MLVVDSKRDFSASDFGRARFGSFLSPGVRFRPLPVKTPVYDSDVYIEVNSRDRTSAVEWENLEVNNVLTRQVDTCRFNYKKTSASQFEVEAGDNVKVYDTGTLIFQGVVTKVEQTQLSASMVRVNVEASDYTFELDGKVVGKDYTSQSVNFIINDIVLRYAPQFTTNHVNCPQTVNYVNFPYQPISSCLQELSDMVGYDWYIDENKDIHFGPATDNTAPFDITDTAGVYELGTLTFKDDISQVRNKVYLRGGDETGASQTYSKIADGTQKVFNCGYHFSAKPTVTNAGAGQTVGTLNVDDPTVYQCMWDPTHDLIQFAAAPTNGNIIAVTGTPLNPILLQLPSQTSIDAHGQRDLTIIDKTLTTRAGARQRAMAELVRYAEMLESGSFVTLTKGLKAGMSLNINSTLFGVSDSFVITQVSTSMRSPTTFMYKVTFVSTKLMDYTDLMVKMLRSKLKEQKYSTNESFDPTGFQTETATIVESAAASTSHNSQADSTSSSDGAVLAGGTGINFGTIFVFGPWTPSSTKRQFNFDRSLLG